MHFNPASAASRRHRRLARTLHAPLTIGVPMTCAQCAMPTAAPATYRGEVRNDTSTPLLVRFKHRRQCIAKAPPCFTSARSAFVHRHRFSRTRYTPARTPRLPAAPAAAAAFTTSSWGNADRRTEERRARLSARAAAAVSGLPTGDERGRRKRVDASACAPATAVHVPAARSAFTSAGMTRGDRAPRVSCQPPRARRCCHCRSRTAGCDRGGWVLGSENFG